MPITATPTAPNSQCGDPLSNNNAPPVLQPVSCFGQSIIAPRTPADAVTGKAILTRTFAANIPGAQEATIRYTMRNAAGQPINLVSCTCTDEGGGLSVSEVDDENNNCPYELVFRLCEYLSGGGTEYMANIIDAVNGVVEVVLPKAATQVPGVYFGEFALVARESQTLPVVPTNDLSDTTVLFSNKIYVHIGRNLWNNRMRCGSPAGPPSIAEVRMHLRDTDPSESHLLDNVAFSDEEILAAAWMAVSYWNEQPPDLGPYTTATFPFRYNWLIAISGYLFLTAAEQQRRNHLTYSAGGVQIDDQNREVNYERAAQLRLDEWRKFVRLKKSELNLNAAWASHGSPYRY